MTKAPSTVSWYVRHSRPCSLRVRPWGCGHLRASYQVQGLQTVLHNVAVTEQVRRDGDIAHNALSRPTRQTCTSPSIILQQQSAPAGDTVYFERTSRSLHSLWHIDKSSAIASGRNSSESLPPLKTNALVIVPQISLCELLKHINNNNGKISVQELRAERSLPK